MSTPAEITTTNTTAISPPPPIQPPGTMPTSSYVHFTLNHLATFPGILKVICLVWNFFDPINKLTYQFELHFCLTKWVFLCFRLLYL